MPDFSILQQPDFAKAALGGFQAGHAVGQQRRMDAALGGVDLTRPETIVPVLQLDPQTGAALLGASSKLADQQRETASRAAMTKALIAKLGGGDQPISAPAASPQPGAVPSEPGDITVIAAPALAPAKPMLSDAERAWITADPDGYLAAQTHLGALDKAGREKIADTAEAQAVVANGAMKLPYEQRRAYIQSQAGYLSAHGVTPEMIAGFDPTDQAVQGQVNQALGLQGMMERTDKDRTFGETSRHNRATEGSAAANVDVARGRLGLARQSEARSAKGGGAGGAVSGMSTADLLRLAGEQ